MPRVTPSTTRNPHFADPLAGHPVERELAQIGGRLAVSISEVVGSLPGAPLRPVDLTRDLGINKVVSSRLFKAIESKDEIAVVHLMPGPEPLRRLLKAAKRKKVAPQVIKQAEDSIAQFERLIRETTGDRSGLDTIIGAWLPDVREKAELLSKQAAFKGMSQILGIQRDAAVLTSFLHPARESDLYDMALLTVSLGLRRLRPGRELCEVTADMGAPMQGRPVRTLDGQPCASGHDVLLTQFCSSPTPQISIHDDAPGVTHFVIEGDDVGHRSAVDLAWAHTVRDVHIRAVGTEVSMPTKKLTLNLLLHNDIEQRTDPILEIHDTAIRGLVRFNDPDRVRDMLDLQAHVDYLGLGAAKIRSNDVPRYAEMIGHVCDKMRWAASEFHCYRCEMEYPIYGSQLAIGFDPSDVDRTRSIAAGEQATITKPSKHLKRRQQR